MPRLKDGSIIRNTLTVVSMLGEGAFSEVYLARHKYLGLQAVKVFKTDGTATGPDPFREAFILSRIEHPNIIRLFEANTDSIAGQTISYLSMEYVPEGTLADYLNRPGQLAIPECIRLQRAICSGLAVAHSQTPPIIHRDIKPQNILIKGMTEPVPKLADFGLAKNIDPVLRMATAAGTLSYMPPEGFLSYETPESDVYSAGLVFYEMLTGSVPFSLITETNPIQYRRDLARERSTLPPPPSRFRPDTPKEVDDICLTALQPARKQRFPSANEFLQALERVSLDNGSSCSEPETARPSNELVARALHLARQYAHLDEAIDLLESAIRVDPTLQSRYGSTLRQWKSGVML